MGDPYFWGQRSADTDPRPITDFTDASITQYDPDDSPHTIPDLDPGEYDIYVSEGASGEKRGPLAHVQKHPLIPGYPNMVAAWAAGYIDVNPVLEARRVSDDTTKDHGASEVSDGVLATFSNGGDVDVSKLYDQSGNGRTATAPSGASEPGVVQGGSLVTDANGDPTVDLASGEQLTASVPTASGELLVALQANPSTSMSQVLADVNAMVVKADGSNITAEVSAPGTSFQTLSGEVGYASDSVAWNGNVYYCYIDSGKVYEIDTSNNSFSEFGDTGTTGLHVLTVLDGDLMAFNYSNAYRWDGASFVSAGSLPVIPNTGNETAIVVDDSGTYWFGGNRGQLIEVNYTSGGNVSGTVVWDYYRDNGIRGMAYHNGRVWFSLYDGSDDEVRYYDISAGTQTYHTSIGSGQSSNVGLFEMDGSLYVISEGQNQVYKWDGSSFNTFVSASGASAIEGRAKWQGKYWLQGYTDLYSFDGVNAPVLHTSAASQFKTMASAGGGSLYVAFGNDWRELPLIMSQAQAPRGTGKKTIVVGYDTNASEIIVRVGGTEDVQTLNSPPGGEGMLSLSDPDSPLDGTIQTALVWDEVKSASDRDSIASVL